MRLAGSCVRSGLVPALAALGAAMVAGLGALFVFTAPTWAQTSSSSSSDPGRIVYVSDRNNPASSRNLGPDVYTMKPDGTDVKRVTNRPGSESYPSISPDGRKIAFVGSNPSGNDTIYTVDSRLINADNSAVTNLTNTADLKDKSYLSWSPDGKVVFGARASDSSKRDVYEVSADGTGSVNNLTDTPDIDEGQPAMSPNGQKIAYYVNDYPGCNQLRSPEPLGDSECSGTEDIYTTNTDKSGEPKNVSSTPATIQVHWRYIGGFGLGEDPDDPHDDYALYVQTVSATYAVERQPTWSSDSQEITYVSYSQTGSYRNYYYTLNELSFGRPSYQVILEPVEESRDIYKMSALDGSAKTHVVQWAPYHDPNEQASVPSISPDGTELIFASNRTLPNNPATPTFGRDWDIQKAKADGSSTTNTLENLTEGDKVHNSFSGPSSREANDLYPQWGKTPPPDETAPTTTITATTSDNESYASDSWTNHDLTIALKTADEEGGTGIKSLYYKTEGAHQEEQALNGTDNATINISEEGVTTVTAYATDKAGNAEESPQVFTVKVDKTAPSVATTVPNNEDKGVSRATPVTVSLPSEAPIDPGTVTPQTFQLFSGNSKTPLKSQVSMKDGYTVTLSPPQKLDAKIKYTAKLKGGSNGVKDLAGNALPEEYVWYFTTGSQ